MLVPAPPVVTGATGAADGSAAAEEPDRPLPLRAFARSSEAFRRASIPRADIFIVGFPPGIPGLPPAAAVRIPL